MTRLNGSPEVKPDIKLLLRGSYLQQQHLKNALAQEQCRMLGIVEASGLSPDEVNVILGAPVMRCSEEQPETIPERKANQ